MDISPDKQNIDKLFGTTPYYIDFYQRDYKWTAEPVQRLLDDIFYAFNEAYKKHEDISPSPEAIAEKYPWYYLNTYVTNAVGGRVYIVDGQQRLTTLTLILIGLMHRAQGAGSKLSDWISYKIAGQAGFQKQFWMNHERHIETLRALYDGEDDIPVESGITALNMLANYNLISGRLSAELKSKHKLETFIFYFLHRLVLINLSVEQTDVPMIFEVINDRGVRLRPYEILKGKLLGQIDKFELESENFNQIWEDAVDRVNDYGEDEIDAFFIYYLKAKYADTRKSGQRFDSDYHREMFKADINEKMKLERNPQRAKHFLKGELTYFTKLFGRMWQYAQREHDGFEHVYYNRLNEMDSQFHLVLSACQLDDPDEDLKIRLVAYHVDRLFVLLRLQRSYDSNDFATAVYEISTALREKPASEIPAVFEAKLLAMLQDSRASATTMPFDYAFFRNTSITEIPTRFTRYFFARIDRLLARETNLQEYQPFADLVSKTGAKTGFHIEHILSRNEENLSLYGDDDDLFEADRNRLGAILLLKGKDNISSSNEPYRDKLRTYAKTLHWNETLRHDSYKAKKDFEAFQTASGIHFEPMDEFGPNQVEARQKLLFALASCLWMHDQISA